MFGAAKKIQYNRYCARYKKGKFREMNEERGGGGHWARESGTDLSPRLTPHYSPKGISPLHQPTDSDSRQGDSFRSETFRANMLSVDSNKSIPEENEEVELSTKPTSITAQVTDFKLED